jgi:DMSO/TMAO reductase YedYZ molybdopterin-dependent catalytic subunit
MLLLRSTIGVRSIPERLMEWLLLFVPPGAFEAMLQRFGFDAKRYALWASVATLLACLAGLGAWILQIGWRVRLIGATGLALWLLVMLVVMPLTSAGPFATGLLTGTRAAVGGYLAVSFTYAAVLGAAYLYGRGRTRRRSDGNRSASARLPDPVQRRAVVALAGGAVVAYVGTVLVSRLLPERTDLASVVLADPQEPFPSGGVEPQNPHPNVVATSAPPQLDPGVAPIDSKPAPPKPADPSAAPTPGLPEPTDSRDLVRDKDGAVVPTSRPAGDLAPAITSNADFYVVTKNAGGDPLIHPQDWHLVVDGEVDRPFQLEYATLRKMSSVEVTKTLECISNMVGKPELAPFGAELISTAVWRGVPVRDILTLVGGPRSTAEWVAVLAADEYTTALPLAVVMDPATLLVYEMNNEVLPREHGYPARLLVPDRYGMKNPKWVVGLRPMRREFLDWYGQRQWTRTGVVKPMTRLDTPAPGAPPSPGKQAIGGIAYAGARGIQKVEFSVDAGQTWRDAELIDGPAPGEDRWARWQAQFDLASNLEAKLKARATDGAGQLQIETFSLPQPDGGSGWPQLEVHAS